MVPATSTVPATHRELDRAEFRHASAVPSGSFSTRKSPRSSAMESSHVATVTGTPLSSLSVVSETMNSRYFPMVSA